MATRPPMHAPARRVGPWGATALVVGNIIGVGVYVLPTSLAPYGWGSLAGWALTLGGALCLAWILATLARHVPDAGGAMGCVRVAFGGDIAFLTAWGYWVSTWVSNAVIAMAGVNYLGRLVPALAASRPGSAAVAVALLWMLTGVNLRGPRAAGALQLLTTVLKGWPFVAVLLVAVTSVVSPTPLQWQPVHAGQFSLASVTATVTLTLYAMTGLESAAVPAGAVDNPGVIVPRATMAGTLCAGLANMLLSMTLIALVPAAQLAASTAPVADFIGARMGVVSLTLVSVSVVISAFGCLNGWILLAGEIPAALADGHDLPAWWGHRNRHGAAGHALLVSSGLTTVILALQADARFEQVFTFALLLSTATILVLYLLLPLVAWRFAARGLVPRGLGLTLASAGAGVFAVWALMGAGRAALTWGSMLVLAGWPLYRVMRRRASPSPAERA